MAATKNTLAISTTGQAPFLVLKDGVTQRLNAPWAAGVFTSQINKLVFSPDVKWLAAAYSISPYVVIFNSKDWTKVNNPAVLPTGASNGVAFSANNSRLAVAHNTTPFITIYNTVDWSKLANPATLPTGQGQACAFNVAGTRLAVGHGTTPFFTQYDTSSWAKLANPGTLPISQVNGIAYSPDGTKLAMGENSPPYLHIYNTSDMSKIANPSVLPVSQATAVAFSPDGAKLAVAHVSTPFLRIYNVSDWSSITVSLPSVVLSAATTGNDVFWLSNSQLILTTNGCPGIIEYTVTSSTATIANTDQSAFNIKAIAAIRSTGWKFDGTVDETLAADTFYADAYDFDSGVPLGHVEFTGTSFSIPIGHPGSLRVVVTPKIGTMWEAGKPYTTGTKVYPTNPEGTPFYYQASTGGTTDLTEPSWPVLAGGTVIDGTVTWQLVERIAEPEAKGPHLPVPV